MLSHSLLFMPIVCFIYDIWHIFINIVETNEVLMLTKLSTIIHTSQGALQVEVSEVQPIIAIPQRTVVLNYKLRDKNGRYYLDVPLEQHMIQFFLQEYGEGKPFVNARLNGPLGASVLMIAEKQPYRFLRNSQRIPGKKLRVYLPDKLDGCTVRYEMLMAFSEHLSTMFREQFVSFVNGAVRCGSSESGAVTRFLSHYQISEDDWSFDAARRHVRSVNQTRRKN